MQVKMLSIKHLTITAVAYVVCIPELMPIYCINTNSFMRYTYMYSYLLFVNDVRPKTIERKAQNAD